MASSAPSPNPNLAKELAGLIEHATDVFGDKAVAERWMETPNLATDDQPPMTLLGSEEGYLRVKTLIDRIDYGVLA